MATFLNTEHDGEGIRLFFDGGELAGMLINVAGKWWRHMDPDDQWTGPRRTTLEAAQFDALAWAAEHVAARRSTAA